MVVNIHKKAEELKLKAPDLITRSIGRRMYSSAVKIIDAASDGEVVVLDFDGIKVIDSSFIDEFLVKLIVDSIEEKKSFFIKLKNISNITEINIDLVFKSYSNYNKRIAVITDNICQNNNFFIGPLTDKEKDIIDYIRVNKTATASDLVKFTGLSEEELMSEMEVLYLMRIIRKDGANYSAV